MLKGYHAARSRNVIRVVEGHWRHAFPSIANASLLAAKLALLDTNAVWGEYERDQYLGPVFHKMPEYRAKIAGYIIEASLQGGSRMTVWIDFRNDGHDVLVDMQFFKSSRVRQCRFQALFSGIPDYGCLGYIFQKYADNGNIIFQESIGELYSDEYVSLEIKK